MRYITVIFIIISFCTLSQAAFDGSSYWPEFYPYLHCDQECIDSMINVNVRWQLNQGQNGWNKYRFGLIGNSVTNDGPFPSDLSEGTQPGGWWGSGIINCTRPDNSFWTAFLSETWGGPGISEQDHPWLYDLTCHRAENGNQSGANTAQGYTLLQNALDNLKPMWVTIMFGHNDGGRWDSGIRSSWDNMLQRALSNNVIPIIMSINPAKANMYGGLNCRPLSDSLRAYARVKRVPFLDWFGAAVDPLIGGCYDRPDTCTRDGVHPERSEYAGNFADYIMFAEYKRPRTLVPVCGILNVMLLEMTYELREKVIYPADLQATGIDNTGKGSGVTSPVLRLLPNPATASTILSYNVPNNFSGRIQVDVFDLKGTLVRNLVNADRTNGSYSITWDAKDNNGNAVTSGIYYVILRAGATVKTMKLAIF
ncbi:MAG: hypothetical protein A2268_12650 [Candidatus Raymondbacteria bacterium RifOxyA12_full_50_37]|uniref:FlgD Ig-like domain-containing protein n=1 Tax=Candidatus Raymondbacteria bacterium RIFOXYD12_FULL_49_13 TaxID=1817890 RepID=A0A1F7FB84_UNCRA|nr:MAG: hypothetical protein A2268_12650 [Candidatus Raymondbacteria bacterium RifOxyA12_full_50_37]OGJ91025.1 MAG: hypothetical protein A2248_00670 [Candidatus Raymondbacteria bacterium RIFOXYA2_FULL_49_16]OGJ97462.1 MAG: hypothetical protein A2453_10220 [Candidatus Raymondbacteria bacterium RIFOXYC2_FULL_50_21]OGJ97792.1 MAG: hypothetical protein A2487_13245 [Candidatus Raymondbacteria bacterium RifOxyC12_full_50_8]OGJ99726.1 MAG: hypothetical protein A2350_08925 [Candidatus Raymondbacteria b